LILILLAVIIVLATGLRHTNDHWYLYKILLTPSEPYWTEEDGKRYYIGKSGKKVTDSEIVIDGNTYLFDEDGAAVSGQVKRNGAYYYYDYMLGKQFNAEETIDGKWFFFGGDGRRFGTGWKTLPDGREVYYDKKDGMQFGEQTIDGEDYFLNTSSGDKMTGTLYYMGYKYNISEKGIIDEKVKMKILSGIDVSYHQGPDIDWKKVAGSGIQFAVIRAGVFGSKESPIFQPDELCVRNVSEAQKYGISVGVYIYLYSYESEMIDEGLEQFDSFMNENRLNIDLPAFIDVENEKYFKPATDERGGYEYRTELLSESLKKLRGYGYKPGIYSFYKWANNHLDVPRLIDEGNAFWLARWYDNNKELVPETMTWHDGYPALWQYRDTGKVAGVPKKVDRDYMYLDMMDLS
jgi:GH25 family lysozyme M1 (1,4-beta-N-acetylmuramidase)